MNETYQDYINRVARLALPTSYNNQLQNIQKSPKFEKGIPTSFPGYSVITPPAKSDTINEAFYKNLTNWQEKLCQQLNPDLFVPIPPETFHVTVADLIWSSGYLEITEQNPNFEANLQESIEKSFAEYRKNSRSKNMLLWRSAGLIIKPRALVMSLIPKDEESYQQILKLRRCIYQNSHLIALGIEQQYDLTAHVTIGYFSELASDRAYCQQQQLDRILAELNEQWLTYEPNSFAIEKAELRKFDDMMHYYREQDWATVEF
ncbi:MAG: DUF1868 domain-containing protein [Xenococcaceae cyanobacterium]